MLPLSFYHIRFILQIVYSEIPVVAIDKLVVSNDPIEKFFPIFSNNVKN